MFSLVFLSIGATARAQTGIQVGYATATADSGSIVPVSTVLFSYTNSGGVLVSQAAVSGMQPFRRGLIFIDGTGARTGFVLVNTSAQTANVSLAVKDASGATVTQKQIDLAAGQHLSRYVDELFTLPVSFIGSLSFDSATALGSITLRETVNGFGEPVYATLPALDRDSAASANPVVFPHVAVGSGFSTQLLFMNPASQTLRGQVRFTRSDGQPLEVRLEGQLLTQLTYSISPNGVFRAELQGDSLNVGYAVLTPDAGSSAPAGTAIFRYGIGNKVVSEAAAPVTRATTTARLFVDQIGSRTGLAVCNPNSAAADMQVNLLDTDGNVDATRMISLPAGAHTSIFVDELFPGILGEYTGLLEIRSPLPVVPITLKVTTNARNEPILTTLPVADATPPSPATAIFPHIAIGGGFSTRLIVIHPGGSAPGNVKLSFFNDSGAQLAIPVSGQTQSQFSYPLPIGSGRQLFPGLSGTAARIVVLDPATNQIANEVTINEGHSLRPRIRVIDSLGRLRDDFEWTIRSLDADIADVTGRRVRGNHAGFSTLTLTAGGALSNATATVVALDSAVSGYQTTGVAVDGSQGVYLTASQEHTVLFTPSLQRAPDVYAGRSGNSGLKDDVRNQALFHNPAFLTLNQANGSLYVSDTANHVIRKISPGASGRVETVAGTGVPGSNDGSARQAAFNNPEGIALDHRGNLWIADSENHVIRKLNLVTGAVQTVAGSAGAAGAADGRGASARFNKPMGIAVEVESTAAQLERARTGAPPPPTTLLVADNGNGLVRRVAEDGTVTTIGTSGSPITLLDGFAENAVSDSALRFSEPTGVGVDAAGNIYVAESRTGLVRVVFRAGGAGTASEPNSFVQPQAVAPTSAGSLIVTDGSQAARQIRHGEPRMTSISPDRTGLKGGDLITLRGRNFSPESLVIVASAVARATVVDTGTITFVAPPAVLSGTVTVTVQNRGGIAQAPFFVVPPPLESLAPGQITTYAGGATYIGDGLAATSAVVPVPGAVALDSAGNLYISDPQNARIRKVRFGTGIITTVAGNGSRIFAGDNGPAIAASLKFQGGITVDQSGNLYIADAGNQRVRKVDAATGVIRTIAGSGNCEGTSSCIGTFSGDNGPATAAGLNCPSGVAVDGAGNVFVYDLCNARIRKIDAQTGIITTYAGNGFGGYAGDRGPATSARIPSDGGTMTLDPSGNVIIVDTNNGRIRRVDSATGMIDTIVGPSDLNRPAGVAFDQSSNLLIVESGSPYIGGNRIRKVAADTQVITTIAGTGEYGYSGDGQAASIARFANPSSIAIDAAGNVFVADTDNDRVRRLSAGVVTTTAGSGDFVFTGDGKLAAGAGICLPQDVAVDPKDNIYLSHWCGGRVRRVDRATGVITTVAGNDHYSFSGDNGPGVSASFRGPQGVAADASGNVFVADQFDNRVRRIDGRTGVITTFAGGDTAGFSGDGGPASGAMLSFPSELALDRTGNLFILDGGNGRIRRVDAVTRVITTVASGLTAGHIALDFSGNVFFTEPTRIAKIAAPGAVSTVFSNGLYFGALALDAQGNIVVAAGAGLPQVWKLQTQTGRLTLIAGILPDSANPPLGDGGPATSAYFWPNSIAIDSQGNVFIADSDHNRVRVIRGPIP